MKTLGILVAGCFTVSALLCANRAQADNPCVTVRVVTPFPTGHILADTAFKFKEVLEKKTHGRIAVTVATSVLNEQTINPAMVSCDPAGRVGDIMLTGGQPIQDWAPQYFFFNGPYVIEDYDHFLRVWNGDLGDEARALINASGNLVSLGTVYRGFRQFTSNSAINGPADLVGLLLRLPPVPDWVAVWSSLGAQPVQVPLTGLYDALASGAAQASEGDLTQISSFELYEVQSHLSLTNHLVGFGLVLANECFMTELKRSDERKIEKAMKEATEFGTDKLFDGEAALIASLQANGMTVVTPDAAAIREAARPAIDQLFATKWTVTTWDEVLAQ